MKRVVIPVNLIGPSGDVEEWKIIVAPIKPLGYTNWINRTLTIASRQHFGSEGLALTLLHEIVHVTAGQNASEKLAENVEYNYKKAVRKLSKVLNSED